jgi:hypothetical protein
MRREMNYCLCCEHASGEDVLACCLTETRLGSVGDLVDREVPSDCPLPLEARHVPPLPKYGPTRDHPRGRPRVPKSHDPFECFGRDYGWKKLCGTCPKNSECAEKWSATTWNTHKARGYGRGQNTPGNSWDNVVEITED